MKNPILILAACVAVVLFAAGCEKNEPIKSAPVTVVPKLPEPNVPKHDLPPAPHPGQGNDTSSPAFKSGGEPDPHK